MLLLQVEENMGALPIINKLTPDVMVKIDSIVNGQYD